MLAWGPIFALGLALHLALGSSECTLILLCMGIFSIGDTFNLVLVGSSEIARHTLILLSVYYL